MRGQANSNISLQASDAKLTPACTVVIVEDKLGKWQGERKRKEVMRASHCQDTPLTAADWLSRRTLTTRRCSFASTSGPWPSDTTTGQGKERALCRLCLPAGMRPSPLGSFIATVGLIIIAPGGALVRTPCWARTTVGGGRLVTSVRGGARQVKSTAAMTTRAAEGAAGEHATKKRVYAYLHGFLSGPDSYKGRRLQSYLQTLGVDLHLLDLNGKDGYPGIRYSDALRRVSEFAETAAAGAASLTLFGSSLGGYVASLYAQLHPEQVEKIVLFCPGYDLHSRWPRLFGEKVLEDWKRDGFRTFEVRGQEVRVPFAFVQDGRLHPPFPSYCCPALVFHGVNDEVVPVQTTLEALDRSDTVRANTMLYLLDDDHALTKDRTLETAFKTIAEFLDVRIPGAASPPPSADRIEVEKKFELGDKRTGLETKLRELGAKFKGTVKMTDIYWDVSDTHSLSRANSWLRQRAGIWELKVPAVQGEKPNTLATACYREITGDEDIAAWLRSALPHVFAQPASEWGGLEQMLVGADCSPMLRYMTTRTKWSLDDLVLDMDETDFNYSIVEIELLCQSHGELPAATKRIEDVARRLGLLKGVEDRPQSSSSSSPSGPSKGPQRGKLEEYILRTKPALHDILVKDGIFSPPT